MRMTVYLLCGLQFAVVALLVVQALLMSSDKAGEAMVAGFATLAVLVVLLTGLPALLMAKANRLLPLALVLAAIVPVGVGYLYLDGVL